MLDRTQVPLARNGIAEYWHSRQFSELKTAYCRFLFHLELKGVEFPFVENMGYGPALFVGEGNLSFSLSIARAVGRNVKNVTAATFEKQQYISSETRLNALRLRTLGVAVQFGVDATRLESRFRGKTFATIVFQFPNIASRRPLYGRNPNHILAKRFLRSAAKHLKKDGQVVITTVNNPFYLGAFNLPKAAADTGYSEAEITPFKPSSYHGYRHTNTDGTGSALMRHNSFSTWVFNLKEKG